MLHPAIAHFAISLPVISLVLGLLYIFKPTDIMSKISTRFLVFSTLFMIVAFFSGREIEAPAVYSSLSVAGQELFVQHAKLGLYITIAMAFVTVMKFYGCLRKKFLIELFSVVFLVVIASVNIYQGKLGGELTYNYGAHVKDYKIGQDCIEFENED